MRVFFGLELEAQTALEIAHWRDRQFSCTGRAVPAANFHITLAFVGDQTQPALERLCLSVDEWLDRNEIRGGELNLNQTGYWHRAEIYWLGPQTWPKPLSLLAAKLARLASRAGAKLDKRSYQPHITLFRRCSAAPPAPATPPSIDLSYRHFTLFESRRGQQGVSYHPIQHWGLLSQAT